MTTPKASARYLIQAFRLGRKPDGGKGEIRVTKCFTANTEPGAAAACRDWLKSNLTLCRVEAIDTTTYSRVANANR